MSVVVPTLRRVADLERCLTALATQNRPADEVLVTVQEGDLQTKTFLGEWALAREGSADRVPVRVVRLFKTGQVWALQRGLEEATGDVVAFTDDDAAPRPDWLERIESHFLADERIAGVGGRDWVHELGATLDGSENDVGRLTWYGKFVGNHHLGVGPARRVDALKGVNMAYRREVLLSVGFDERLRGGGAQVGNEIAVGLPLRRAGWTLVYDPAVALDHYPAVRHDADERYVFKYEPGVDATHNETLPVLEHLRWPRRWIYLFWGFLVGTRRSWGLLQWVRFWPTESFGGWRKLKAGWRGRWLAWRVAGKAGVVSERFVRPGANGAGSRGVT